MNRSNLMPIEPLVVILVSVYRGDEPDQVQTMIDSMLRQSYSKIIIFIHIDGVISESLEAILANVARHFPKKIKISRSETNHGLARSLNGLIERASKYHPRYYARMDADDVSLRRRIEKQVEFMEEEAVDIAGTDCREFGSSESRNRTTMPTEHDGIIVSLILRSPFIHPTVMIRDTVIDAGIRYPENFDKKEDIAMWGDILAQGFKASNLSERLLLFRMTNETLQRRLGIQSFRVELAVRFSNAKKLGQDSPFTRLKIFVKCVTRLLPHGAAKILYRVAR